MFSILLASATSFTLSCKDVNEIVNNIKNVKDFSSQMKEELIVEVVKIKPKDCVVR